MISIRNLRKSYDGGETFAVDSVDLDIEKRELLVLLGESGCGKTTTLKMINRLIEPTAGTIAVDGEETGRLDPVELRRRIGYVFQGIGLFPHLTVAENVAVVPRLLGWENSRIDQRVDQLLDMIGLPPAEYRARPPAELSGGQRQRVGLARALAARPKIMLMDEPFGALDPLTREGLQREFRKIHRDLELTTIMVTHDITEALLMADRIAVMLGGTILQVGTPHELLTAPQESYVEELFGMPKRQTAELEALMADSGEAS
jgi:osmoprotectant transport system ATP-binding protein